MKRKIIFLFLLLPLSATIKAQQGNNQMKIAAEVGFPSGGYHTGYGVFFKGLLGVGSSGQLTLTTGVSRFGSSGSNDVTGSVVRLIPFMAGYRQNIGKFYIEPQIGYGDFGGRITMNGDYARPSIAAFFWSAATGFNFKRFDAGVKFQSAHGAEGSAAGTWHNSSFQYTALYLGVNLF